MKSIKIFQNKTIRQDNKTMDNNRDNNISDEIWCFKNILEYYNKKGGEDGVHYYTLKYMYEKMCGISIDNF